MAIENTYLLGKNITLGCGFDLQAKAPLDSRQTVPSTAGLQALIDGNAAYEGMIVYDEESKKTYQAQIIDDVLAFREFGINEAELRDLIASETTAAMEFKGATTSLPENPSKGDMYKVASKFKVDGEEVLVGDSIVYDGETWFIIPSGDDIEDTWRPVTDVDNNSTLTFVAGDKLEKTVAADGTITYKHVAIDAPEDMTAEDDEKTRTYITQLITDNHGHIIGFKTATENVEDTNTEYTFEGQSDEATSVYFQVTSNEEGASAEVVYLDAYSKNEADGKFVAKETGKSLVSDDEIARLAEVDNYDDEEVRGLIGDNAQAIEDLEAYVGTIPTDEKYADITNVISYINKKSEETLAAAQGGSSETAASVKQQLDNYKSENDTRVKAVEDDIDVVEGRMDTAEGKIANLETESAKHAVKSEVETALNGKVDKVEGKSLIDDTEIARLATLANYDDTQVKADIAKKADAETMITELGKKVDKVDGKDLIATSEIERLATLKNYDDTALAGRVATAEGKIATLETASAKHALKTEVEAVDAKFADYNTTVAQKAIDDAQDARIKTIEDDYLVEADIANFETKDNVKKVADDLSAYVESNDKALADVKATAESARTEDEVNSQIDTKIAALNLGTTYEPIGAEDRAKAYVDGKFTDANLAQYTTEQEVKDIVDGVIAGAADKDTYNSLTKLVDYIDAHGGEATEMASAIETLEGDVKGLKEAPSAGIKATDIEAWNGEIGAKALAESKTTTAEVKDQIEAYGYATTGYADGKANDAKDAAIADAASKYETKGTAQGIVDALKLGETYEPIGAETRAIAAAKSETENQVKALAGEGNTSTIKKNADDIASLFEQMTWGEF
jgi:hypothetical protein